MNTAEASPSSQRIDLKLEPVNTDALRLLLGELNGNLRLIEKRLNVRIAAHHNLISIDGEAEAISRAAWTLESGYQQALKGEPLTTSEINMAMTDDGGENAGDVVISLRQGLSIRGRNFRQRHYLRQIDEHDVTFGVGPAGTGKTFLAVAAATQALTENRVERIVLVRPAVEAGERLGFLPGDIGQKVDPYLRPLYDALYEMLGFERVGKLMERGVIELAPLAYMRGRTLNRAFIILDEAQNTTVEQMKMFLTRLGMGSQAVVTGDTSQIDLPRGVRSGLKHAVGILDGVDGIAITRFRAEDVVRHPLVQRIVEAYEEEDDDRA